MKKLTLDSHLPIAPGASFSLVVRMPNGRRFLLTGLEVEADCATSFRLRDIKADRRSVFSEEIDWAPCEVFAPDAIAVSLRTSPADEFQVDLESVASTRVTFRGSLIGKEVE